MDEEGGGMILANATNDIQVVTAMHEEIDHIKNNNTAPPS
jgi:hypothetical protein